MRKFSVFLIPLLLGIFMGGTIVELTPLLADSPPDSGWRLSSVSPALSDFLDRHPSPCSEKGLGFIPSPHDFNYLEGEFPPAEAQAYPSFYDLREQGKVSPVRDQGSYNTCWAFATFGSLESCLLPDELRDFSEDNMINLHGFDLGYNEGGNYDMATAYLARWSGPVSESDDPYLDHWSPQGLPPQKHVQEVIYLPPITYSSNAIIKWALMNYGAVATSIYWNEGYYTPWNTSYYYNGTHAPNHAVTIVGWDDNYSRINFEGASGMPPKNGAFIVRNSWGASWGEGGYFYVSYCDSMIGRNNALFPSAEPTSNYDRIYQYDPLGWTASGGFESSTGWFAAVFDHTTTETLMAVSFYTPSMNTNYEIYLSPNYSGSNLKGSWIASGSIQYPGYHTVSLAPRSLPPGRFSVAVKLTTPGYNYPVPVEAPIQGYSSQARAYPGESFVSPDGISWEDLDTISPNSSVCLKAFTQGALAPSSWIKVLSPNGGEVWNIGELQRISWTYYNCKSGVKIEISRDGGQTYSEVITPFYPVDNCGYNWVVSGPPSSTCKIRITSVDDSNCQDVSDAPFTIPIPEGYWEQINNGLTEPVVFSLAIDPKNSSTIFAGTTPYFGGGLFKSTDAGATWNRSSEGITAHDVVCLAIDPKNPSIVYAGTRGGGLFKSTDAGATWHSSSSGISDLIIMSLAIDPVNPSILYAGTCFSGVYKSTDAGATWFPSSEGLGNQTVLALAIDPGTPSILYCGTFTGGLFKSTDAGATWLSSSQGILNQNVTSLAINLYNPSIIYAGTACGLFISNDGAEHWHPSLSSTISEQWISCLAIDPLQPSTLYAGSSQGVFKSKDGGTSFLYIGPGPYDPAHAIAVDPQNSSYVYLGTNSGVYLWSPPPLISLSPLSLTFTCTLDGANPPPQALEVWNSGGGTLNWTASANSSWLSLSPTTGSSRGEKNSITISADTSGLYLGTHTSTITITSTLAINSPQTVTVRLTITPSSAEAFLFHLASGWNMFSLPVITDPNPSNVFSSLSGTW
ncbi:MAG: lectin like domain-containing protein, partial [bacterium]